MEGERRREKLIDFHDRKFHKISPCIKFDIIHVQIYKSVVEQAGAELG